MQLHISRTILKCLQQVLTCSKEVDLEVVVWS